jgi:hypothetical protein
LKDRQAGDLETVEEKGHQKALTKKPGCSEMKTGSMDFHFLPNSRF